MKALRVLLVDDNPDRGAWLETCLQQEGYQTCSVLSDHVGVLRQISEHQPDIIVIEMDSPGRDLLESLSIVSAHSPTAIVMFSQEEDPDYINRAVDAGVTAYMVGEIQADSVKPAIDVAMAQFRSFQKLRNELDATRSALADRNSVDQAKAVLMAQLGLTEQDAYEKIRAMAMSEQLKMKQIAARILAAYDRGKK
ncbi:MAG: response regulator NasT [Candidatus Azotimanducaceae bacterium]|jgi:response regulator NasT